MNVLIALWQFLTLTGAEMYAYELARGLVARGQRVTVTAPRVGGEIAVRAQAFGVNVVRRDDLTETAFDILHLQQPEPTAWALQRFPEAPAVMTVHGRVEPFERPVLDERIRRYICVLPEIQDRAIHKYGVPEEQTTVIYNPIDRRRFNTDGAEAVDPPTILMAGTLNDIRAPMFRRLQWIAARDRMQLVVIGGQMATWDIEHHVKRARLVAGLYLGRAVIEGWCCGKTALVFHYDDTGLVIDDEHRLDPPADLTMFDAEHVTDQTLAVYRKAAEGASVGADLGKGRKTPENAKNPPAAL